MEAVAASDVQKLMWWTSHKAQINCEYPKGSGRTPLHEALVVGNVNMIGFLLLNGADMYATDVSGNSPLSMIESGIHFVTETTASNALVQEISDICSQILRGDF